MRSKKFAGSSRRGGNTILTNAATSHPDGGVSAEPALLDGAAADRLGGGPRSQPLVARASRSALCLVSNMLMAVLASAAFVMRSRISAAILLFRCTAGRASIASNQRI